MSDSFQSIAFPEVDPEHAEAVASHLRKALISNDIVAPRPVEGCVLDGTGHPPAQQFRSALEEPESGAHLLTLKTNGVVFQEEPAVYSGSEPPETTDCPRCNHTFEGGEDFVELVGDWFEGEQPKLECPTCKTSSPLEQFMVSPAWALAHVGMTFWNWPQLSDDFVDSLSKVVGSKAVVVEGKL